MVRRVMLAVKAGSLEDIRYPVLASYKIDGIRAVYTGGKLLTRSMKPIPNKYINEVINSMSGIDGLDGEIVVGPPNAEDCYTKTVSGVMSVEGQPDFTWYVFDNCESNELYFSRAFGTRHVVKSINRQSVEWLPQKVIRSRGGLEHMEQEALDKGFEGLIIRDPRGEYKQGRSTLRQGYLVKIKRFMDSEAEVLGSEEQMHNDNEATLDERGYTKRSSHKGNKEGAGVLGSLQVRDCETGVEFDVGTGFTHEQRKNLWKGRKYLVGKIIKYKHFPLGVKDKPRFPTFLGIRDRRDM